VTPVEGILADGNLFVPQLSILPTATSTDKLVVYQNRPNPFTRKSMFPVIVPEAGTLQVTVYNTDGSLVYKDEIDVTAGYHEVLIDATNIGGPGVYTCTISTATEYRTLRMIVVDE